MNQLCKYCKKLIKYKKGKQFGAHVSNCKDNPNFWKGLEKTRKKCLEKSDRKYYKFKCKKCNKSYILKLTTYKFINNDYRKNCSRKCANSHIQTEEMNKRRSLKLKGKTYEEIMGIERTKRKKEKLRLANRKIKNTNQIKDVLKDVFKYEGRIFKKEFFNNAVVKKELGICDTIRRNLSIENLTLDDIAVQAGVQFKQSKTGIGINETQILDDIEKEKDIKLKRQFNVDKFYIDGYDTINNVAYEVDELHHKYQQIKDIIRENIIKEALGCKVVRIKDGW